MGRLKELNYKNMWSTWIHRNMSPTMAAKGCILKNICLIVSNTAHLSIKYDLTTDLDLMQQLREKMVYLKPHDSVQRS